MDGKMVERGEVSFRVVGCRWVGYCVEYFTDDIMRWAAATSGLGTETRDAYNV